MNTSALAELFARDLERLRHQIEAFPEESGPLWDTPPGISNSAGTLVLHLEGNLRGFIGHHLAGVAYQRDRAFEFGAKGLGKADLLARIGHLAQTIPPQVAGITAEQLASTFPVEPWGHPIGTEQFLLHLYGHLNYHLGQIGYLRRMITGQAAIPLAALATR